MNRSRRPKSPPPEFGKYLAITSSVIGMPPPPGEAERFDAARARALAGAATPEDVALLRGIDAAQAGGHREIRRLLTLATAPRREPRP